jgi:hypothetical protein
MMNNALRYLLELLGMALLLVLACFWLSWPSVRAGIIEKDLDAYARQIRHSTSCPTTCKESLLDRIDAVDDAIQAGKSVGLLRWLRHDRAIRQVLRGKLTRDNARLIERELRRVEKELGDGS